MGAITPQLSASSTRILLVDDNTDGLAARKCVLEELGYQITTASGALEALDVFQPGAFDLIITDYRMPMMDGVAFIEQIRAREPKVPVILISGFADALGLNEQNTGADVVIQKSATEVGHLVRAVNRLLKRKAPPRKPVVAQRNLNLKANPKAK
ncbi:MAG: response regulator [Bryobacteraceae bacterium]|nr:response regulator [Bryobacteraceae bacterium]